MRISVSRKAQRAISTQKDEREQQGSRHLSPPPLQLTTEGFPTDSTRLPLQRKNHEDACGCKACMAAQMREAPGSFRPLQLEPDPSPATPDTKPKAEGETKDEEVKFGKVSSKYKISAYTFLGISIEKSRGVNEEMAKRLTKVQDVLKQKYKETLKTDKDPTWEEVRKFAGVETIKGYRSSSKTYHGTGSAVDVNYDNQPYIPTRSGKTYGGEGGNKGYYSAKSAKTKAEGAKKTKAAELKKLQDSGTASADAISKAEKALAAAKTALSEAQDKFDAAKKWNEAVKPMRKDSLAVYDRAVDFARTKKDQADKAQVHKRGEDESVGDAYDRFQYTSDALADYFQIAFTTEIEVPDPENEDQKKKELRTEVLRKSKDFKTKSQLDKLSGDKLKAVFDASELKDRDKALEAIKARMADPGWLELHAEDKRTAEEVYDQILRDYEVVRKLWQRNSVSTSGKPANTRNPALGFMHMKKLFVETMVEAGKLRWGACDLGSLSSGDIHHFDLGDDGRRPSK